MFGRKRRKNQPAEAAAVDQVTSEFPPPPEPGFDRSAGPFDVSELESLDGHADFGGLLVPRIDGLQLRLEQAPGTGQLVAMTFVVGAAMVQVRALAAPRSGGLWAQNRPDLERQIQAAGGRAEEVQGPFGVELHAHVPMQHEGATLIHRMRYVGVDGPRWFLMGSFAGAGAEPSNWDQANDVFRNLAVVRGSQAMPVGSVLPLTPPQGAEQPAQPVQPVTQEPLQPGARITEVR